MKVYLSELAESKLHKLNQYLLENWGLKTRNKFIDKLNAKINQISTQPHSCPQSEYYKGIFKAVVTKNSVLFYRINCQKEEIEVITLFDARQNPERLEEELK